jgi:putative PIN family toxin of toxin-antitoxin system
MGKKKKGVTRVVQDTNVLVSALLFKGRVSRFVALWQQGNMTPLLSKETFGELKKVLTYPKFALDQEEIGGILEDEVLPFFEIVDPVERIEGVCTDPDDDPFIACAVSGGAEFVVTGDAQRVGLRQYKTVRFVTPSEFLKRFASMGPT